MRYNDCSACACSALSLRRRARPWHFQDTCSCLQRPNASAPRRPRLVRLRMSLVRRGGAGASSWSPTIVTAGISRASRAPARTTRERFRRPRSHWRLATGGKIIFLQRGRSTNTKFSTLWIIADQEEWPARNDLKPPTAHHTSSRTVQSSLASASAK